MKQGLGFYIKSVHWELFGGSCKEPDSAKVDLIWIDPNNTIYESTKLKIKQYTPGAVVSGFWDITQTEFSETIVYRSLFNHFVQGKDWEETKKYKQDIRLIEAGEKSLTTDELISRYEKLDEIFEDIARNGFKTQDELLNTSPAETKRLNDDTTDPLLNEISICIGRDGTIFRHGSGRHRLAMAKILNLSQIPVLVRVRHQRWQALRDRIRRSTSVNEIKYPDDKLTTHPDISDFV